MLTLLASALVLFVCELLYELPWYLFLLLLPVSLLTFILSLVIGYFLAEPLRLLLKKVKAYRAGVAVSFEPDGRLLEADELSNSMDPSKPTFRARTAARTSSSATLPTSCARR